MAYPGEPTGLASFGTLLQTIISAEGVTPTVWATIFGVGDIEGPSVSMDETETTSHSTLTPIKTFIPSLIDPGELSFPYFWRPDDATQSLSSYYGLENMFYARKMTSWRIVCADPGKSTREFRGFIKEISEAYPVSGVATKNCTIRISGAMSQVVAAITTLTPAQNITVPKAGASATITVTSSDTVTAWFPTADVSWISFTAPAAAVFGNGTVNYTVAASPLSTTRSAIIRIGDKTFPVTQLST